MPGCQQSNHKNRLLYVKLYIHSLPPTWTSNTNETKKKTFNISYNSAILFVVTTM